MSSLDPEESPIREPAVAGSFYPADPARLRREVLEHLGRSGDPPSPASGLLAPHAGYRYSGGVAGATYAQAELPRDLVILCPNHTGLGSPVAVMRRGRWRTPLGLAPILEPLADLILEECSLAGPDERAHLREHALEVQLPFLQVRLESFRFVPICVGTGRLSELTRLGLDLARALGRWPGPVGLIVSSDMSHYVPADLAREKDMMAVERILTLDAEGLHRVVHEADISMCGFAPAVAGLTALRQAGATAARLVAYANSGDASGDLDRVVGYAGLVIS